MTDDETRGVLTEADKEWLRGEVEYEHRQTAAQRRREIRERVGQAMKDFEFLLEYWEPEERNKLAEETDLETAAASMIEFLYVTLNKQDADEMLEEDAEPVESLLSFRRALSRGVQQGKEHFGEAPNPVNIDSNAKLYEFPPDEEFQSALDTEQWRDANEYVRGAFNSDDDAVIDKNEAVTIFKNNLIAEIEHELVMRRQQAGSEIRRHDQELGSPGVL